MDFVSLLSLIVVCVAVSGLAVALILTIRANYLTGWRFRQQLSERVNRLRLGRMLARRGINVQEYLHRIPVVQLDREARACEGCNQTRTCEEVLARGTAGTSLDFCVNHNEFSASADGKGLHQIH